MLAIGKEMNTGKQIISNLEELINKSLEKLENIKDLWLSGNLEDKRRLNKTLFPEGIYFDPKKHQYLTRKINSYLELVDSISRSYADKKIGPSKKIIGKSYPVARMGFEPMCARGAYESCAH